MNRASVAITAIALAAGVGCTTTGPEGAAASDFSPSEDCMFARALRDWRPLDNEHLILFANGRTPYLVELVRPAFGLTFDIMIGVYDRDGRICPFGGDAIIVDTGGMPDRVQIRSMQRLTETELSGVYVQYGIETPVVDSFEEVGEEGADE